MLRVNLKVKGLVFANCFKIGCKFIRKLVNLVNAKFHSCFQSIMDDAMATIGTKFEFTPVTCRVMTPNEMQPLTAHQNCKNSREVNLFLGKYLAHPPQLFTFFPSRVMLMHDKRRVVRRETGRIIKIAERDFCVLAFTYLFVVYFSFSVYSVFLIFSGKNYGHSYLSVSFQHLHNSSTPNWHQIYMYVTSLRLEQILH